MVFQVSELSLLCSSAWQELFSCKACRWANRVRHVRVLLFRRQWRQNSSIRARGVRFLNQIQLATTSRHVDDASCFMAMCTCAIIASAAILLLQRYYRFLEIGSQDSTTSIDIAIKRYYRNIAPTLDWATVKKCLAWGKLAIGSIFHWREDLSEKRGTQRRGQLPFSPTVGDCKLHYCLPYVWRCLFVLPCSENWNKTCGNLIWWNLLDHHQTRWAQCQLVAICRESRQPLHSWGQTALVHSSNQQDMYHISDSVGTTSNCSLLVFPLSVSLAPSRLHCLCFSVSISKSYTVVDYS